MIRDTIGLLARKEGIVYLVFVVFFALTVGNMRILNSDFYKAYYPAAESIVESGTFSYDYRGVKNLPIVSLLTAPFALFDEELAGCLFTLFQLLAYLLTFALFCRYLTHSMADRWFALFLFVACKQCYTALGYGQLTFLAFLTFIAMSIAYLRGRSYLSGALLSATFLIKIPPGLLFFYFLRKQDYRLVVSSVISFMALLVLSVAYFGVDLHLEYHEQVLATNSGATLVAHNNQNIFAFVMRLLHGPDLFDWHMVPIPKPLYYSMAGTIILFLIYIMRLLPARRQQDTVGIALEISIFVCNFLVVFPISWNHYYLFLIFPFYALYESFKIDPRPLAISLAIVSFLVVNMPDPWLTAPGITQALVKTFVVSLPMFGAMLLLYVLICTHRGRTHRLADT